MNKKTLNRNMICTSLKPAILTLMFFNFDSSVEGSQRLFEHQLSFNGFMCSTTQYLGKKRSILHCSEVCARDTRCVGFFFNHLNNKCSGSSVVYVVPTECQWTGDDTYFYLDGKLLIVNVKKVISFAHLCDSLCF